jgi:hypothetical protein
MNSLQAMLVTLLSDKKLGLIYPFQKKSQGTDDSLHGQECKKN